MTYHVRLRLKELLEQRGMKQIELAHLLGIGQDAVGNMVSKPRLRLRTELIAQLIEVFDVEPNELFEFVAEDVFFSARVLGELTVHLACSSIHGAARGHEPFHVDTLSLNYWDLCAFDHIRDHAESLGIRVRLVPHRPYDRPDKLVDRLFKEGAHVFVGSQLTAQLTEWVVSRMYKVTAYDVSRTDDFPATMGWDRRPELSGKSAFGFQVSGNQKPGIYRGDQLIAERTHEEAGQGKDCGLIVTWRDTDGIAPNGFRKDRCLVVCSGHGGPGTEACAKVLVDPAYAVEVYPTQALKPRMRAVVADYSRPPMTIRDGFDNRELISQSLLDIDLSKAPERAA
jgi:transcriptional regulator with XRE-family HTH domain